MKWERDRNCQLPSRKTANAIILHLYRRRKFTYPFLAFSVNIIKSMTNYTEKYSPSTYQQLMMYFWMSLRLAKPILGEDKHSIVFFYVTQALRLGEASRPVINKSSHLATSSTSRSMRHISLSLRWMRRKNYLKLSRRDRPLTIWENMKGQQTKKKKERTKEWRVKERKGIKICSVPTARTVSPLWLPPPHLLLPLPRPHSPRGPINVGSSPDLYWNIPRLDNMSSDLKLHIQTNLLIRKLYFSEILRQNRWFCT